MSSSSLIELEEYLSQNDDDDLVNVALYCKGLEPMMVLTTSKPKFKEGTAIYDISIPALRQRKKEDDHELDVFLAKMKTVQMQRKQAFEKVKRIVNLELEMNEVEVGDVGDLDFDPDLSQAEDSKDETGMCENGSSEPLFNASTWQSRKQLRNFGRINDIEAVRTSCLASNSADVLLQIDSSLRALDLSRSYADSHRERSEQQTFESLTFPASPDSSSAKPKHVAGSSASASELYSLQSLLGFDEVEVCAETKNEKENEKENERIENLLDLSTSSPAEPIRRASATSPVDKKVLAVGFNAQAQRTAQQTTVQLSGDESCTRNFPLLTLTSRLSEREENSRTFGTASMKVGPLAPQPKQLLHPVVSARPNSSSVSLPRHWSWNRCGERVAVSDAPSRLSCNFDFSKRGPKHNERNRGTNRGEHCSDAPLSSAARKRIRSSPQPTLGLVDFPTYKTSTTDTPIVKMVHVDLGAARVGQGRSALKIGQVALTSRQPSRRYPGEIEYISDEDEDDEVEVI